MSLEGGGGVQFKALILFSLSISVWTDRGEYGQVHRIFQLVRYFHGGWTKPEISP